MNKKAYDIVEEKLNDLCSRITNEDESVTSKMATTNASCFDLSDHDIATAVYKSNDEIAFEATLYLSGEQDEDRPFCGSEIKATVSGHLEKQQGNKWDIVDYDVTSCSITDFGADDDEAEEET